MDPGNLQLPFQMNFEMSIIYGMLLQGPPGSARGFRPGLDPLTLQALADTRRAQLAIWREKSLPPTELVRWQRRVEQAGHLEAYNYWLFRSARPAEFEEWRRSHKAEYKAWHEWHRANGMSPAAPDFQRLHLKPGAAANSEIRVLIRRMSRDNPTWG